MPSQMAMERARRYDHETGLLIVPRLFPADPKLNTVYIMFDGSTFSNMAEAMDPSPKGKK